MPTQTTIKRTITIKKYIITTSVISANKATPSADAARPETISAAAAPATPAAI